MRPSTRAKALAAAEQMTEEEIGGVVSAILATCMKETPAPLIALVALNLATRMIRDGGPPELGAVADELAGSFRVDVDGDGNDTSDAFVAFRPPPPILVKP